MASKNPKQQNGFRLQHKFWLNIDKPDEAAIDAIVEKLKTKRRYAAAIRDGLRLVWDLSQGKTDVLLELFPFVKTALASGGNDSGGGISKADLERLEILIKERKQEPPLAASGLQPMGGPKPLGGLKPIAPPAYDEDEDLLIPVSKAEGGGNEATNNFLKSMMALQQ